MSKTETAREQAYSKAEAKAQEQLDSWDDVELKLGLRGFSPRQIQRYKKNLLLNAKGIFR